LEQGDFKGRISLLYSRRPSVLDSLNREGSPVEVYLAEEDDLAGVGACAVNEMKIQGEIRRTAYLFSFRMNKNTPSALRHFREGYAFHFSRMKELGIGDCFTTILEDNKPAIQLLEKKRRAMPHYDYQGDIITLTLKTGGMGKLPKGWTLGIPKEEDLDEMLQFYDEQMDRYSYAPQLKKEELLKGHSCPHYSNFRLMRDSRGSILAMGAIWDQRNYKQYTVMGYQGLVKYIRPLTPMIFPFFGYPGLPRKGSVLKMFSLAFCLCKDSHSTIFMEFLGEIRRQTRGFDCLTIGLHEKDPLLAPIKKLPHIQYKSRFYRVFEQYQDQAPLDKIPFIEIGRL
jgi:hypothetical protein